MMNKTKRKTKKNSKYSKSTSSLKSKYEQAHIKTIKKYYINKPNFNNNKAIIPKNNSYINDVLFISLGIDCGPKLLFDRVKINQPTFPFDWCNTYNGVTEIIKNGYKPFQDKLINMHYVFPILDHEKLIDLKNGIVFLHDDINDIEEKYKRRLSRLHKYLYAYNTSLNNQQVIFIRKSHNIYMHKDDIIIKKYNYKFKDDIEDAKELNKYIKNKYPKLNFKIYVYLKCNQCYNKYKYNVFTIDKNIIIKQDKYNEILCQVLPKKFKDFFYPILDKLYTYKN